MLFPPFWTNQGVEPEVTASNQGRHSSCNLFYKLSRDFIKIAGPDDGDAHVSVKEKWSNTHCGRVLGGVLVSGSVISSDKY